MERRTASVHLQALQDIFGRCRQNRRDFLLRAGKITASGIAATALFENPRFNEAQAQQPRRPASGRRPQRVAVIGAGHYHATLAPFYLKILQDEKLDIVGVHDPDRAVAEDRARRCGSTPYTDYRAMLDRTKPEFVLSLNRHVDMPGAFRFLVDSGIPFLAEKPWGVDARTVNELADYAEKKKAWATAVLASTPQGFS